MKNWREAAAAAFVLGVLSLSACSDTPAGVLQDAQKPLAPQFGQTSPSNGEGDCMFKDAQDAGYKQNQLNCTANDVDIGQADIVYYALGSQPAGLPPGNGWTALGVGERISCTPGQHVFAFVTALIQNSANERYDMGLWVLDPGLAGDANTGTRCSHYNLVPGQNGAVSLDGDQCGDLNNTTSTISVPLDVLDLTCPGGGATTVSVEACAGWSNSTSGGNDVICPISPPGGAEGFRMGTTPPEGSKCKCNTLALPIDVKGVLRIVKETEPNGDPQSFNFSANYPSAATFALTDGQTNNSPPLSAGTYTVTETVPTGWVLQPRECHLTGSATTKTFTPTAEGVQVALGAGEDVTCTFTNTKDGQITIVKDAVPNDAQDFAFAGNITGCTSFSLDDDADGTLSNTKVCAVHPGTFNVDETVPTGWVKTSATCSDGSPITAISVSPGENITCTFTNTKDGQITIVKDAVPNDPQDFAFAGNITACTSFSLDDDADGTLSNTKVCAVNPGTFNVDETVPTGWVKTSATCSDGSPITAINVSPGENITCTFTNTKDGQITIVKDAVPNDPQDFAFAGNITGCTSFSLDDDADGTLSNTKVCAVHPGTFNVDETVPTGWVKTSATCSDGSPITAINVSAGENITCTFTNTKDGQITIVKDVQNPASDPQDFAFAGNITGCTSFSLDDDADGTLSNTKVCAVHPGTFNVDETVPANWAKTSATCSDGSPITAINVGPGEALTCTFVNQRKARLVVEKIVVGGGTQAFDFSRTGISNFVLLNGQTNDSGFTLTPGTYKVCELSLAVAWATTAALTPGGAVTLYNPDAQDVGNRCYDVTLGYGNDVKITFTNTPPPGGGTRTIGYWKNWSSCTGGNQYEKAAANDMLEATLDFYLTTANPGPIYPIGDYTGPLTCTQAVSLLSKDAIDGSKRAGDPIYNLVAQLLGAKLNLAAGAGTCTAVQTALTSAQTLLDAINFVGTGSYKEKGVLTDAQLTQARTLAGTLGSYNEGTLGGSCPSHVQ